MHIGLVGLGKMGANMRLRLRERGVEVTGFDPNPEVSDAVDLPALVAALPGGRRVVWVMVPAGAPTRDVVSELGGLLGEGDVVVEGGNSHYTDDIEHAAQLAELGVHYVDVGVSGGIWGRTEGYGLMAGGAPEDIELLLPVLDALRPDGPREQGFVHAGPVGAGHFAKMVHNGIEYGLMQDYAEGYELLEAEDLITDVTHPQGLEARHRRAVLAARPAGGSLGGGPRARRYRRLGRGLRRGQVDGRRGDRPGGPGAGDLRRPVRAVRVAPGGLPGDEGCRRPASAVR